MSKGRPLVVLGDLVVVMQAGAAGDTLVVLHGPFLGAKLPRKHFETVSELATQFVDEAIEPEWLEEFLDEL